MHGMTIGVCMSNLTLLHAALKAHTYTCQNIGIFVGVNPIAN